ncbi:MAG: hypothetical protein ACI8QD_001603 [Cyclobacteriaceae bacterium]|jgi:hypothetical protein
MKKLLYVLISLLLVQVSCDINQLEFDNLETPRLESLIAVPLGEFNYTLLELIDELGDQTLSLEEDSATSLLSLVYYDTLQYAANDDQFVVVNDINSSLTIPLPVTPSVRADTTIQISESYEIPYAAENGDGIDSIVYATGDLQINFSSATTGINFDVTINDTRSSAGLPVSFIGAVPATPSQDLAGFNTTLTQVNGLTSLTVTIELTIALAAGESIGGGESVDFSLAYTNQTFSIFYGDFGRDTLDIGTINFPVDFFESLGGNNAVAFRAPSINLIVDNSIGVPLGLLFNNVYGLSDPDTTRLTGPVSTSPQPIVSPNISQIGETLNSTVSINASNSNLDVLFSNTPSELNFSIAGISNPGANSNRNFFVPGAANDIDAVIEMRLPMEMKLTNLTREISFDVDNLDVEGTDSVTLRLVTLNLLPFSTLMDVSFVGAADTVIYTLDPQLVMATPFIGINFEANEAEPNVADLPLSSEGLDALMQTTRIDVTLTLNTPSTLNSREIFPRWLSRYDLTVKLSALVKLDRQL